MSQTHEKALIVCFWIGEHSNGWKTRITIHVNPSRTVPHVGFNRCASAISRLPGLDPSCGVVGKVGRYEVGWGVLGADRRQKTVCVLILG